MAGTITSLTLDSGIEEATTLYASDKILIKTPVIGQKVGNSIKYIYQDTYITAGDFKSSVWSNDPISDGSDSSGLIYFSYVPVENQTLTLIAGTYSIKICGAGGSGAYLPNISIPDAYNPGQVVTYPRLLLSGGSGACVIATFTLTNTTNFTINIGKGGSVSEVEYETGVSGEDSSFISSDNSLKIIVGGGTGATPTYDSHVDAQHPSGVDECEPGKGGLVKDASSSSISFSVSQSSDGNDGSYKWVDISSTNLEEQSAPAISDFPYGLGVGISVVQNLVGYSKLFDRSNGAIVIIKTN